MESFRPYLKTPSFYGDEILVGNDIYISDHVFDEPNRKNLLDFLDDLDSIYLTKKKKDLDPAINSDVSTETEEDAEPETDTDLDTNLEDESGLEGLDIS